MMTSQIPKSADFTKTQNLNISRTKHSFIQKIHKLHIKGYFIAKNSFVAEVTFKMQQQNSRQPGA